MIAPIERATPKPKKTSIGLHGTANAGATTSGATKKGATSSSSTVDRALKSAGLDDTARETRRGAREIHKAIDKSPSFGRKAVAAAYETANAAIRTSIATQKDIADRAGDLARPILKHGVKAAAAATEPMRRETVEAASEVGAAVTNSAHSHASRFADTSKAAADAWESEDGLGRKLTASGFEVLAGGVKQTVGDTLDALNVGREVAEGGFEIAVNNPVTEATRAGATQVGTGLWDAASSAAGFGRDTAVRGANGAAEATKTAGATGSSVLSRTIGQQKENAQEILDAGRGVLTNQLDRATKASDAITDAWESEDDLGRKVTAAGYEVVASSVQNTLGTGVDVAKVGLETVEANIENTVSAVKSGADLVSGNVQAVGSFVSGLFG